MGNMRPQAPKDNQQTWASLESYCRSLVDAGNELHISCGPCSKGGTGTNGYATTIDAISKPRATTCCRPSLPLAKAPLKPTPIAALPASIS